MLKRLGVILPSSRATVSRWQGFALWALWCVIYLGFALWLAGLSREYPGDELRFIDTSRQFASGITVDLLRHYSEMSGPLPFAIFSLWGGTFGWALSSMRLLAVAIGFVTLLLMFEWLREVLQSQPAALLTAFVLCLNPYVATMSVFLYTDMISVLFVMSALLAVERNHPVLLGIALSAALLSRQYLIFVVVALGLHYLAKRNYSMLAAVAASALPLAWFVWLWKGLAPASPMRSVYGDPGLPFHLSAFVGYVGLLAVFLAPFLMVRWRMYFPQLRTALLIAAVSPLAWLFPVRPSPSAVAAGLSTVGLLDRGLHLMLPQTTAFYALAFVMGLLMVAVLLRDAMRQKLPALIVIAFLVVMPFSYLYWEKYMLPVLPVAAVAVLRKGRWYPESI